MHADRAAREAPGLARGAGGRDRPLFQAYLLDEDTEASVRGGLAEWATVVTIRRGGIETAIRTLEREPTPRILLVDVAGIADPVEPLERLAGVCQPDVRVIVVGERTEISFYRYVTRELGVADYVHKPLTRDIAGRLIGPYLAGDSESGDPASRGGHIVAVCGARGGAGATTVAANLALHLAKTTHGHVALLDLHLRGGQAGLLLGVQAGPGLRSALEDPERADSLFLDRCATPVGDRLKLIAADEPMDVLPVPAEGGVTKLLALLRQRFNRIVIDLPFPLCAAGRAALPAARLLIGVTTPDLGGLRNAVAMRRLCASGAPRFVTVLNRDGMPGGLKRKHVVEGLGEEPDIVIPDLPREVPRAADLGTPAVESSRAFRRALAPLTQEVGAVHAVQEGGSLLSRFLGRGR